jgi:hypothetical protein
MNAANLVLKTMFVNHAEPTRLSNSSTDPMNPREKKYRAVTRYLKVAASHGVFNCILLSHSARLNDSKHGLSESRDDSFEIVFGNVTHHCKRLSGSSLPVSEDCVVISSEKIRESSCRYRSEHFFLNNKKNNFH